MFVFKERFPFKRRHVRSCSLLRNCGISLSTVAAYFWMTGMQDTFARKRFSRWKIDDDEKLGERGRFYFLPSRILHSACLIRKKGWRGNNRVESLHRFCIEFRALSVCIVAPVPFTPPESIILGPLCLFRPVFNFAFNRRQRKHTGVPIFVKQPTLTLLPAFIFLIFFFTLGVKRRFLKPSSFLVREQVFHQPPRVLIL